MAECHGSIHHLQCLADCGQPVWPADDFSPVVDTANCLLVSDLPLCPACGAMARPNIMMFGDDGFDGARTQQQTDRLETWLARLRQAVVIEIGAGTAIATVRHFGESTHRPLIRINPGEPAVALRRDIAIPLGALDAMARIALALQDIAAPPARL